MSKKDFIDQPKFQELLKKARKFKDNKLKPIKVNLPVDNRYSKEIILESSGIRLSFPVDIHIALLTAAIREIKKCS